VIKIDDSVIVNIFKQWLNRTDCEIFLRIQRLVHSTRICPLLSVKVQKNHAHVGRSSPVIVNEPSLVLCIQLYSPFLVEKKQKKKKKRKRKKEKEKKEKEKKEKEKKRN